MINLNNIWKLSLIAFGLHIIIGIFCENVSTDDTNMSISDIADHLIGIINNNVSQTSKISKQRFQELKEKLSVIATYVIDRDKYSLILMNETRDENLTHINFFDALKGENNFDHELNKSTKSLYLTLKDRMNKDDVVKILSEKSNIHKKLFNAARRSMNNFDVEKWNVYPKWDRPDEVVDSIVNKMMSSEPSDSHKFDNEAADSIYWDPNAELEDLKDYHTHDGRRIFKGEKAHIRNYPFMVSIHLLGRFWCGGVVYWHDLILTSCSCLQLLHNNRFFRENPRVLKVRIASNHSRVGGEMIDAHEVYFHPAYNPKTLVYNVAVIRLRRHIMFKYRRIPKCIDISHNTKPVPSTNEILILGWGVFRTGQTMKYEPVFLQKKMLPVYPNYFCKEVYGEKFIKNTMFCAGTMTTGEGACDHDAGGPAILGGKLVGIISFGPSVCGYPNAPTVFTHIGQIADWIEIINETMPGYYRGKVKTTTLPTTQKTTPPAAAEGDETTVAETVVVIEGEPEPGG